MSKMTHAAHEEDGGDNQAVEADGCHNGNPDQQTVDFFTFLPPAGGLVVWRKRAGHIQWTWSVSFSVSDVTREPESLPSTCGRIH